MNALARRRRTTGGALALAMFLAPAVWGDFDGRGRRADVDIDSLKAELWRVRGAWELQVRYDIEIEDFRPFERFELELFLTERGHPLRDQFGRPLRFVVALRHPTDIDDDELEFESGLTLTLPPGAVRDPGDLRLHGRVVRAGGGHPLDMKDTRVKYKRPKHRHHYVEAQRVRTHRTATRHATRAAIRIRR